MDRSGSPRAAAGVRFVTEPDGTVTAEHVESGATGTGGTAVEALRALYESTPDLDPPADAGLQGGNGDPPDRPSEEWEWISPEAIRPSRGKDPDR